MENITQASRELFVAYYNDAPNWNGTPAIGHNVSSTQQSNGNLTQLKISGLITTWVDENVSWLRFTDAGLNYAKLLGLNPPCWI